MDHLHLKYTVLLLIGVGFWPLKFSKKSYQLLYKFYYRTNVTIFTVFVLSQYIEFYFLDKNLDDITGLLSVNLVYVLGLVKLYVVNGPTVNKLVKNITATEKTIKDEAGVVLEIYKKYVVKNWFANKIIITLGPFCVLVFILTPPITELVKPMDAYYEIINGTHVYYARPLPLTSSWFPFDRYKYYGWAFAWHTLVANLITYTIVACNSVFFSLIYFAVGQINILQNGFENFIKDDKDLRKLLTYHNAIIRFVEELDDTMRIFFLLDFAVCALQIAIIVFQVGVGELSVQLLKNIVYLDTMLTQVFLFYWFGNEILLESLKISDAVWRSQWYAFSNKTKKTLLQVMGRSQKPLQLSVGIFYQVSTATMVTIFRTSYSYAAVMRQFYSRQG